MDSKTILRFIKSKGKLLRGVMISFIVKTNTYNEFDAITLVIMICMVFLQNIHINKFCTQEGLLHGSVYYFKKEDVHRDCLFICLCVRVASTTIKYIPPHHQTAFMYAHCTTAHTHFIWMQRHNTHGRRKKEMAK